MRRTNFITHLSVWDEDCRHQLRILRPNGEWDKCLDYYLRSNYFYRTVHAQTKEPLRFKINKVKDFDFLHFMEEVEGHVFESEIEFLNAITNCKVTTLTNLKEFDIEISKNKRDLQPKN